MRIEVVTLFPELVRDALRHGVLGRAQQRGLLEVGTEDPRAHVRDVHKTVDDRPYGGGPGMVMKPEPLSAAIGAAMARLPEGARRIALSAQGRPLTQQRVRELAAGPGLLLVAGRYEGIDERVTHLVTDRVSIGPYVLSGGEIAAMATLDAVTRKLPGAISNPESIVSESHAPELEGGAEYPHYTRPAEFRGWEVPEVLRSGHHAAIERWRAEQVRKR